tara:strand:- start:3765 stop:4337 length:573 start_codon:yes stop_codon:yes gene_type:complete
MMLSKIEEILTRLLSLFIILIISPILIVVYLLIIYFDGPPAVYKSKRMGFLNKEFTFYKFRTMTNNKDVSKRVITKFGRFLRRSSIDELPQLFNIMSGLMNFVGPRPLPKESYKTEQMKKYRLFRLSIKPGLTGLSQINTLGKPRSVDDKLKYDIEYIKSRNILLDILIIIQTISTLFRRFKVNKTGGTL